MLDEMKQLMRVLLADNELFDLAAEGLKKSHAALIKAGFTEEQATSIIASQGTLIKAKA